ncbi:MAG: hypothetical protein QXW20_07480 [Ignisphaera sp.]
MAEDYSRREATYIGGGFRVRICVDNDCRDASHGFETSVRAGSKIKIIAPLNGIHRPLSGSFEVQHRIVFDRIVLRPRTLTSKDFIEIASSPSNTFEYDFSSLRYPEYQINVLYKMVDCVVYDHIGYAISDKPHHIEVFCNSTRGDLYGYYDATVYSKGVYVGRWRDICKA